MATQELKFEKKGEISLSRERILTALFEENRHDLLLRLNENDFTALEEIRQVYLDNKKPDDDMEDDAMEEVDIDIGELKMELDVIPTNLNKTKEILTRVLKYASEEDKVLIHKILDFENDPTAALGASLDIASSEASYSWLVCECVNSMVENLDFFPDESEVEECQNESDALKIIASLCY